MTIVVGALAAWILFAAGEWFAFAVVVLVGVVDTLASRLQQRTAPEREQIEALALARLRFVLKIIAVLLLSYGAYVYLRG